MFLAPAVQYMLYFYEEENTWRFEIGLLEVFVYILQENDP